MSAASPASTRILRLLRETIGTSSWDLSFGCDAEVLVHVPAEGVRFLVRTTVQLTGNPDEPIRCLEISALGESGGALSPRHVVHGRRDDEAAADSARDDGARC